MRLILLTLLAYLAFVLEAMGLGSRWDGVHPQALAVVVALGAWSGAGWGTVAIATLAGLMCDCLAPGRLGIDAALAGMIGGLVGWGCARFQLRSALACLTVALLVSAGLSLGSFAIHAQLAQTNVDWPQVVRWSAGQSAATAMAVLVLWQIGKLLGKPFGLSAAV